MKEGLRVAALVRAAVARFGQSDVAMRCAAVLRGGEDSELDSYLAGGAIRLAESRDYWRRVWAARGLRYAWDERAAPAVIDALSDDAWRVREWAAKLVLRYELGQAADEVAALGRDPVPRVRAAVAAALAKIGEAEHADVLHDLTDDPESFVRDRAERSLRALSERLDRAL